MNHVRYTPMFPKGGSKRERLHTFALFFSERGTYVHVRYMLSAVRLSVCRLSVCNVGAPYSAG